MKTGKGSPSFPNVNRDPKSKIIVEPDINFQPNSKNVMMYKYLEGKSYKNQHKATEKKLGKNNMSSFRYHLR